MAKKNLPYPAEKIGELLIEVDNEVAKKSDLNDFVKKESGRGLSTNDYTTAEKAKLAGIQEGAQKNTVISVRGALQLNPQVGNVVISAADIGLGNANTRLTSLENNKLDKSEKGATNGVASLDENGRVPSSQLPSYVDDVIDDFNFAQFPATGESGKIYIAKDTNKTYRWSGNGYAEVSASLALGETEQTAYSGAKGKKNAEDIAKLVDDLDKTHQLASNAESAISEVVELTIPAIESDVANKATKTEAQGYATTAESNANDYTNSAVDDLAKGQVATNKANIAKLAKDLDETHQLASNAESAISEVVELTIPAIESDVANKATKTEAQGYATTAESNANDYTNSAVDDLAKGQVATNKANIAKLAKDLDETHQLASNAESAISEAVELTIPAIENELENKLGKTEKAADSANADVANNSILLDGKYSYQYGQNILNETVDIDAMPNGVRGGKLFNATASVVGFPVNADGNGAFLSAAYGKYGIQFIGRHNGYLYARVNDNVVRQWKQLAFTDSTVASADSATTASRLGGSMYEYRSFTKNDNSGWPMLLLLSRCTDLYNGNASSTKQYGFTGVANSSRSEGLTTQDNVVLLTARHGYSSTAANGRALYTSNGYITPSVVKYNDDYYVALIVTGSYRTIALVGKFYNALEDFIKLNYKSASALPTGVEIIQEGNNYFRINALSATKLATARKIWGQSFDGSGNIDGDMEVNGDVVIKGNVVIEGNLTSAASYQSNPLSTISEDEVPSVEQQLRAQIVTLEERIATLEQLIAQNNG